MPRQIHSGAAPSHHAARLFSSRIREVISRVRESVAQDPIGEVWKYLRLFLDSDRAAETLRKIHDVPEGKHKANLKKQAQQIGYCIRQAEQHFRASEQVGLATRPLLLYYGCVSLSQALVLLKKDGTFSLDASRKSRKHNHHGLDLEHGPAEAAAKARTIEGFFSAIRCRCHKGKEGRLAGHFPLFYECLEPSAWLVHSEITHQGRPTTFGRDDPVNCADLLPLEQVGGLLISCWDLIRSLPDLSGTLSELGFAPTLKSGKVRRKVVCWYRPIALNAANDASPGGAAQNQELALTIDTHAFLIDGLSGDDKKSLLKLCERNPLIKLVEEFPAHLHLGLTVRTEAPQQQQSNLGYYPDVVEDVQGRKFFIIDPSTYLPEPASLLILGFCLGMLSRYFPDVWMATIDSNVGVVEATTTLLNVVHRKFPNLILDQMTGIKHYIHG